MIEGSLTVNSQQPTPDLAYEIHGEVEFPELQFRFRKTPKETRVYQVGPDGEELLIGKTKLSRGGPLGLYRRERLDFEVGKQSIMMEDRILSKWIYYRGKKQRLLMNVSSTAPEEPADLDDSGEGDDIEEEETNTAVEISEWRTVELANSRLEQHDYETKFRIYSPNEEEGLIIAFVGFHYWAGQYQPSDA